MTKIFHRHQKRNRHLRVWGQKIRVLQDFSSQRNAVWIKIAVASMELSHSHLFTTDLDNKRGNPKILTASHSDPHPWFKPSREKPKECLLQGQVTTKSLKCRCHFIRVWEAPSRYKVGGVIPSNSPSSSDSSHKCNSMATFNPSI